MQIRFLPMGVSGMVIIAVMLIPLTMQNIGKTKLSEIKKEIKR